MLEAGSRVLAGLAGMPDGSQGATQGFAPEVFGQGVAYGPADDFTRAAVQPHGQVRPAAALARQIRAAADPHSVWSGRGRLAELAVVVGQALA